MPLSRGRVQKINPELPSGPSGRFDKDTGTVVQDVAFDVAVTVSKSGKSGAGLQVGAFGVGGMLEGGSESAQSAVSRIKFVVPVQLPVRAVGVLLPPED